MAIKITIQHNGRIFEPPIESGVSLDWELNESPGKLTFTTVKVPDGSMSFFEGDQVCLYHDGTLKFVGYVFKKKRDKEHRIEVTCYDQIRYLKNKFSYVFENKTASEIIKALCKDFELKVGQIDNTSYSIPVVSEENKSALDIALRVLDETFAHTGERFALLDDCGAIKVLNTAKMFTTNLIFEENAENFDYTSSIDDETYNQVVLYYKKDDKIVQVYTASSPTTIKKWGLLRYFEEVSTPSIAQNQANALLKAYNRKSREFKITGAFGDISVRAGTLVPVKLNIGDTIVNNYLLVTKVTHNFEENQHTMDLTLAGAWEDEDQDIVSKTVGTIPADPIYKEITESKEETDNTPPYEFQVGGSTVHYSSSGELHGGRTGSFAQYNVTVYAFGDTRYRGTFTIKYTNPKGEVKNETFSSAGVVKCKEGTSVTVSIDCVYNLSRRMFGGCDVYGLYGGFKRKDNQRNTRIYEVKQITQNAGFSINWKEDPDNIPLPSNYEEQ